MSSSSYINVRVFWALLRRDLKVLKGKLRTMLIDGAILVITNVIIFGKLFPLLGMPSHFIAPLFLGNGIIMLLLTLGFSFSLKLVYDVQFNRFIDYHLTLPISKTWLFLSYTVSFIIEALIITLPLITLGIILLGDAFSAMQGNWFIFLGVYLLCLLFIALFFLAASLYYDFDWFNSNIWSRRLMPLWCLSTSVVTWNSLTSFSPRIAKIFAFNPFTHMIEAPRAALLGNGQHLPLSLSILGLLCWTTFCCWQLKRGITKRLDPV